MDEKIPPTLKGCEIVIMRPLCQGEKLAEKVKAAEGEATLLPMIEIHPLNIPDSLLTTWCEKARQLDYLFVVSPNAPACLPASLLTALQENNPLRIISMGETTTKALEGKSLSVFFTPSSGATSETLLEEPFLQAQNIKGKSIAILAGEEGRTVLLQTLTGRGASLFSFTVYQQKMPHHTLAPFYQKWRQQKKQALFVATSLAMLKNLLQLTFNQEDKSWLFNQPLVVASFRIAQYAKEFGFKQVVIATGANDNSLLMALYDAAKICNTGNF